MSLKQLHKKWRKFFNESCLKRDKSKCVFCNETHELDVHHIIDRHDMPNGGYATENGITVCNKHHLLCEQFHINGVCEDEYHPDNLYKKINSSYEKAYESCLKLK